ncbi:sulfatase [Radiobacillus sp. PE A8.2]|uniref:sulfatase family protein n=1 Tax=Radiobacillus sp. PE A8.2 TaxID=3380349 RepID=UPI00388DD433
MIKPNIIMVISHDTGRYLGTYGKNIKTPALDQLAEEGIQYDNYFCTQPQCSPSRGSILTGMYGHNHGMMGLAHLGHSMKSDIKTIPSEMKKVGFDTWLFGFSHESINGKRDADLLGYEHFFEIPGNAANDVTDRFEGFLNERAESTDRTPFYVSVGFEETHLPVEHFDPDPIDDIQAPPYLPNTDGIRNDIAHFHGSVKELDKAVGRINHKLKETGLDENTILIYTTDHGIPFPRAKGTLFDAGLETALIMKFPEGLIEGPAKCKELLCNIDLMPTLLELVGADVPNEIDGYSFLSLLQNRDYQPRESFFCELTWHDRYHPMRGIRTRDYKYIRNFEDGPKVYIPLDIHQTSSGKDVREAYYVPNTIEELYDLSKDPLEQDNLAENSNYAYIFKDLRERVENWMIETNDPLLMGPVPGEQALGWEEEIKNGTVY